MMQLSVFKDAVDALEKLARDLVELKNIPRKKRAQFREAVAKSYQLLNTATNLVFLRLGDVLLLQDRAAFVSELRKLDNNAEWINLERDVRLCSNLRDVHGTMDTLLSRMVHFPGRDWSNARVLVDQLLEREGTLADYIGGRLSHLAREAGQAATSENGYQKARLAVQRVRDNVKRERARLLRSEVKFLDASKGKKADA
jgi:hypothetical protein